MTIYLANGTKLALIARETGGLVCLITLFEERFRIN